MLMMDRRRRRILQLGKDMSVCQSQMSLRAVDAEQLRISFNLELDQNRALMGLKFMGTLPNQFIANREANMKVFNSQQTRKLLLSGSLVISLALLYASLTTGFLPQQPGPSRIDKFAARQESLAVENSGASNARALGFAASPITEPSGKSEATSGNTVLRLRKIEDYLNRLNLGVSDEEAARMAGELEMAINQSEEIRKQMGNRLARAFEVDDVLAIYELEQALTASPEGFAVLLAVYENVIDNKGKYDFYALQTLGFHQSEMTDEVRFHHIDRAIEQINRYQSSDLYAGPLGYIARAAADSDFVIPSIQRSIATAAIRNRMSSASTGPAQFATADALYQLSTPQEASRLARELLIGPPSIGFLQATLDAVASGRVAYDPALILTAARIFQAGGFQGQQANSVLALLDVLQKPLLQPIGG
jgi:hypothetical protein